MQVLGKCASSATQCKNGGFPNPSKCSQCICPWGFGGALCDQRPAASNGSTTCGATLQVLTTCASTALNYCYV